MTLAREDLCPVCGYELAFAPWSDDSPSDEICPSCGIQFGYDDAAGGSVACRAGVYERCAASGCTEVILGGALVSLGPTAGSTQPDEACGHRGPRKRYVGSTFAARALTVALNTRLTLGQET
jgi:hypothetical protein